MLYQCFITYIPHCLYVFQDYAKQRFQELADALNTGAPFNFAEDMEALSSAAGVLSKDDLQEIYDDLSGDSR